MRHVAIVGSRRRDDPQSVVDVVTALPADVVVVSGHADGPDIWAEEAAQTRGLRTLIFTPDLNGDLSQGQRTRRYHARNQKIVDAADEVIAFVSLERTGGTEDTIRRARQKGIPVRIL